MADIGVMIAAALLKEVVQQIGSLVGGQMQHNLDKDLKEMKMTLESIDALLKDAERANTNNSMRLWLNRLKDAMYGIADMIDDFEAGTEAGPTSKLSMKKHLAVMMPCFTIGPKLTMANKMKTMREELKGITEQYQKFMLVSGTKDDELEVIQMRETSSTIEASIIGRTEEENKIWVSLCEIMIEELIVLAIHGIGGLGKTTLAKMIYNNKTKFEDYFRVWIYVSEKFDLNKIGNSLISQLSENESTYTEKQMIHRSLAQLFTNKKILIILDDLWAEDDSQLDSLVAMLKVGQGSKVVVIATTRNEEIARKISTIPSYELASLTNEMCWTIIKQKSGFESRDDKEQLNDVGEAIAAKCGGVALAAQSIGSILETMTSNQWKKVRDSDIWKVSNSSLDPKDKAATRVLASLRLSYTFMPRYLKLCFAYLAIFPKGCNISKGDLIHQWISLSFIGATPTFTAWELGEIYITQLLKLSFLEHSKHERLLFDDTDVTAFTMHDLVHDLARSVMDDEILLAGNDGNIGGNRCHYALLNNCSNLEHLDLSRNDGITSLPESFGNLIKLHTLKLSYCYKIQKIPKSIGRIDTLKTLYLDGVYGLHEELVPHPSTSFVPLPNFMVRVIDGESSSNLVCLKDTNPEKLYIFWLQNVKSAEEAQSIKLMEKNNLLTLELSWTEGAERFVDDKVLLKKLVPPKSLQYLEITDYNGVSLPTWVGQQNSWVRLMGMRHLEELSVSASNGMLSIKDCPKLRMGPLLPRAVCMLEINSSDNVLSSWGECRMSSTPECASSSSSSFSSSVSTIHTLAVGYSELPMQQWRLLRHISGLEALTIESCPDMIVSHDIIPHLSSVKHLTIIRCNISSLPHWVMDLTGLEELSIVYCEGIRSLPEGIQQLTKLETLYITECPDLQKWRESEENKMKLAHIKDKRF
ncbi:hypothetical protein ZWY2020_059428 [Hordeum vulgare]|nr:hypothetical protein ZWY2020_059428 [Hordeum vulgare]